MRFMQKVLKSYEEMLKKEWTLYQSKQTEAKGIEYFWIANKEIENLQMFKWCCLIFNAILYHAL